MHTYISDITKSYLEVGNYYTVDVIWLNVDPLSIFVPSKNQDQSIRSLASQTLKGHCGFQQAS